MRRSKLLFVILWACASISCSKKEIPKKISTTTNPQHTTYEGFCLKEPPAAPSGLNPNPPDPELPSEMATLRSTIDVESCNGLDGEPTFFNREMPGLIAIVDCNSKLVRFRTHNWQVNELSTIGPLGNFDVRVMYITRLAFDAKKNQDCWTRLLGHITGHVDCSADFSRSRIEFKTEWSFDDTPPEVMEPPTPGMADLRNGPHCELKPGNCIFTNNASMGCADAP